MIEKIREYIATCPYLDEFIAVNVNYLADKNKAYSVNEGAGYDPVISESITGEKEMQFQFSFDARFKWNDELATNIGNSKFFENFSNWLETKDLNGEYPNIIGITPVSISAITNGFIFATNADEAIYRISCNFIYYKEKNSTISA